jgi:hypothetical protein
MPKNRSSLILLHFCYLANDFIILIKTKIPFKISSSSRHHCAFTANHIIIVYLGSFFLRQYF